MIGLNRVVQVVVVGDTCVAAAGLIHRYEMKSPATFDITGPVTFELAIPTVAYLEANKVALKQATANCTGTPGSN
jgi:hypothetical protein